MYTSSTPGHSVVDAPMVGRATELERVLSAVDNTIAVGQVRLVMLAGEPGVGKTRLARESLARAHALGVRGFRGKCFEQHTVAPFLPFAEPFAAALAEAPPQPSLKLRRSSRRNYVNDGRSWRRSFLSSALCPAGRPRRRNYKSFARQRLSCTHSLRSTRLLCSWRTYTGRTARVLACCCTWAATCVM